MPLPTKWSKYSPESLDRVDPVYGVYELGDENKNIIYIGQGILSERLSAHMKTKGHARYFRFQKTGGKLRAEQRERAEMNAYLRRHDTLPRSNKRREYAPVEWWE